MFSRSHKKCEKSFRSRQNNRHRSRSDGDSQQKLPPLPQSLSIVHDALLSIRTSIWIPNNQHSVPKRASLEGQILETTASRRRVASGKLDELRIAHGCSMLGCSIEWLPERDWYRVMRSARHIQFREVWAAICSRRHLAALGFRRMCGLATLIAFTVGSLGLPVGVSLRTQCDSDASEHAAEMTSSKPLTAADGIESVTAGSQQPDCRCSQAARMAGRCCCSAASPTKRDHSCCSTQNETHPRPTEDKPPAEPVRVLSRTCSCAAGAGLPIVLCAEPRIMTPTPSVIGGVDFRQSVGQPALLIPERFSSPETPPPRSLATVKRVDVVLSSMASRL